MNEIKAELQEKLKTLEDYFEISSLIDSIFSNDLKLFLWQNKRVKRVNNRVFHYAFIHKIDKIEKILRFVPAKTQNFKFEMGLPLYVFSEDKSVAWKCTIKSFEPQLMTCRYPEKVSQAERDLAKRLQFLEVEDEEKHIEQRTAPRKNAKEGQMIGIERLKLSTTSTHFLYDFSQGGMAFLVDDPGEYEVGEKIRLFRLDGVELEKKIDGEVVAIRKKEETLGEFKVCIKFVE